MKCFVAGILLAIVAIASADDAVTDNTVLLHQEVYVKGPAVHLSDIADIRGEAGTVIGLSNSSIMTVACHVVHVHENGNIDMEGQKLVSVNREDPSGIVAGTVRASDVTDSKTVNSSQIPLGIELNNLHRSYRNVAKFGTQAVQNAD